MAFYKNCNVEDWARTDSYRFTVQSKFDSDLLALKKDIRRRNKGIRQYAREIKDKYGLDRATMYLDRVKLERVKLQARGPRTYHALYDCLHPRSYDQSLPHKYAVYYDVYVLNDWTAQQILNTEIREGLSASQQAAISKSRRDEAMFAVQQARMLREKYGIVSFGSPKGTRYESIKKD